ncbi:putative MFS family arabinose efflux permease [Aneurinibacillus soli]|uniref:Purine efflux pump PbuE n=1 Tax=Aneurinibacillus soli TaxID=1500254 RepID=A0A0U4WAM2_9BACL|nr:MFS transporter [Aneurinibacillus soli]PYE58060.1 putative MFS family arabinose efflux permease [Aneurinibacillus soli]BAU25961.1 Purine efflux pump PbuE [Aneurinibacillus soli]
MQPQPLWTKNFIIICASNFFIFMTFYTLLATLPVFVIDVLHGNNQQIGPVMTSFIIAAVLLRPVAGRLLDRMGRKKILVASVVLFMASTFTYAGIQSFLLLLTLRFIHGVSFGVVTTTTGTIANSLVPSERKGEGIGYFATTMNIAMVIGPFLGLTIIYTYNFGVLFAILSVFSLLAFLCASIIRVPVANQPTKNSNQSFHWRSFIEPHAIPISLTGMLLAFAYSGILTFIPVYAKELGLIQTASYFYVVYAAMIILSRPLTGKLFDRLGGHVIVYPSILLYIIGLVTLSQAHTSLSFLVAGAVIGLGYGTLFPIFQTIAIQSSPAHHSGIATGTYLLLYDGGIALGSIILGAVASASNYREMYLVSAVVIAFSALLYYGLCHRQNTHASKEHLKGI